MSTTQDATRPDELVWSAIGDGIQANRGARILWVVPGPEMLGHASAVAAIKRVDGSVVIIQVCRDSKDARPDVLTYGWIDSTDQNIFVGKRG